MGGRVNLDDLEDRFKRIEALITEQPEVKKELGRIYVEFVGQLTNIFGTLLMSAQSDLAIVAKNALADTLKRKEGPVHFTREEAVE
jgi:hypothetical protein